MEKDNNYNTEIEKFRNELNNLFYPKIDEYILNLESLKNTDFKNLSYSDIYEKLIQTIQLLPMSQGTWSSETFNSYKYYRARLNIDITREDINNVKTYSYPPQHVCKENGRANIAGQSVFYCSEHQIIALFECRPKAGDTAYVSIWSGISKQNVEISAFLPHDLPEQNTWDLQGKLEREKILDILHEHPYKSHVEFAHWFITNQFRIEDKPYCITSFVANEALFNKKKEKDLLVYPSAVANTKRSNMIMTPRFVDANLKLDKVIILNILEYDFEKGVLNFDIDKVATVTDNKFTWNDYTQEDLNLFINP